jgi:hypothetical protein
VALVAAEFRSEEPRLVDGCTVNGA